MIKFEYVPTNKEYFTPLKMEIELPDDSGIDNHFDAWKKFMYAMTFSSVDRYEIFDTETEEINDIIWVY